MKIINIVLTNRSGGLEQAFCDYSYNLKAMGHEVLAIVLADAPYQNQLQEIAINFLTIENKFGYYDFFAVNQIKNIIANFDADAIISHAGRSTFLAKKAIKKIKHRKIFQIAVNHSKNVKRSIGCDMIFSVNKEIFFQTIDAGQPESRSFVIPNAINTSDIAQNNNSTSPVSNIANNHIITIGTIGRLHFSKGFDLLIDSFIKISNEYNAHSFVLKIAGDGPELTKLQSMAKRLNSQKANSIQFLGWIENKADFFNSIDIFVLPSRTEPFGIVLLEAMKFRKPIISTNCEGPREVITNNINGILVDNKSSEDYITDGIKEAVIKIVENAEFTSKIINNGSIKLEKHYSFSAMQRNFAEFFNITTKADKS